MRSRLLMFPDFASLHPGSNRLRGPTMLQLYGNTRSRALRCLWMLEEVGQPYELVEKSLRADDLQSADYLRLNPNARIPTLVDGDVVLWESMAINLYLAQKYDGAMRCDARVLGIAAQWSFWAMLEMEALLLELLEHRAMLPEFARCLEGRARRTAAAQAADRA